MIEYYSEGEESVSNLLKNIQELWLDYILQPFSNDCYLENADFSGFIFIGEHILLVFKHGFGVFDRVLRNLSVIDFQIYYIYSY